MKLTNEFLILYEILLKVIFMTWIKFDNAFIDSEDHSTLKDLLKYFGVT